MAAEPMQPSRRRLLRGAMAAAGAGMLAGCDALSRSKGFVGLLERAGFRVRWHEVESPTYADYCCEKAATV